MSTLEERAKTLLARCQLVAEAPASGALDSSPAITHLKPGAVAPRGTGQVLAEDVHRSLSEARTRAELERAVIQGEAALKRAKRTPPPAPELFIHGSTHWKRHIAHQVEKLPNPTADLVGEIARKHGCSRASAYRYAAQYGESKAA